MHAIKGGWTGRPLALAKHNESEGRKTRIRLSKEERKSMVEVFIKKYQESNNGSFPSLNLTHKEVGGSFYTVREIVRDIIQENRVLGPGKLLLEEQNLLLEEHSTYLSLEENPLHSIAIELQSPLTLSSSEVGFPVNYNQCINEEHIFVSDEQYTSTNIQGSQNGAIINGSLVDVSDKDSDEFIETELLVNEHKKVEEVVKEESGMPINHVTPLAADVVINEQTKVEEVLKDESVMPINRVNPLAADVVINGDMEVEEVLKDESEMPINHVSPLEADVVTNEHAKVEEVLKDESGLPINHVNPLAADVVINEHPKVEEVRKDESETPTNLLTHLAADVVINEHPKVEEVRKDESGMPTNLVTHLAADVVVIEHKKVEEVVKEESGMPIHHVTPMAADVVVETFPLDSRAVNSSDVRSETLISTSASEQQVSQTIELESDVSLFNVEGNNSIKVSGRVVEKAEENFASPLSLTLEQGQKSSEIKARNASPSGTENLNKTFSNGIDQASKFKEETEIENKATGGGSQKESVPTLNRINLESWEGMSKNSPKPENNPVMEIFKAFIAAFVKFWSE